MDSTIINSYYCKCSICFENDSEIEFINCGDQFCMICLERYVEYWIKEGSWGLLPVQLTCPVCGIEMVEDDWMPYISDESIELWNKFQLKRAEFIKKFKLSRPCPTCNHSQSILGSGEVNVELFKEVSDQLSCELDKTLSHSALESWRCIFGLENAVDQVLLSDDEEDVCDLSEEEFENNATLRVLFDEFINLIGKIQEEGHLKGDLIALIIKFGRCFLNQLSLKHHLFLFIEMQLNFQLAFPFGVCDECNEEFCLSCLKRTLDYDDDEDDERHQHGNMRLDGSKQCPRCFISIEKDSDGGGCNEMKCSYCGMKFCWECGKKWSRACGFYTCRNRKEIKNNSSIPRSELEIENEQLSIKRRIIERDPEIGVPNIKTIYK